MRDAVRHMSGSGGTEPVCTVVIPTLNNEFYTRLCLDSLARHRATDPPYGLVIVDNGSSDGTRALLATRRGEIARTIENPRNEGFAIACNQGAAKATTPYLVFLNNDTVVETGWLGSLVQTAESDPTIGIVGGRLLYPNGTIQHAGIAFGPDLRSFHAYAGYPADHPAVQTPREYQAVTGACMLVRRELFEALGGFDPGYRNSFEDVDLCLRARERGSRVIYCPAAVVHHFESATPGRFAHDEQNLALFRSRFASRVRIDNAEVRAPLSGIASEASVMLAQIDALSREVGALRAERSAWQALIGSAMSGRVASSPPAKSKSAARGDNAIDAIYQPASLPPLYTGSRVPIPVLVRNAGRQTWPAGRYSLSYRWRRAGDCDSRDLERTSTALAGPVRPNDCLTILATLVAPHEAGEYLLEWDLVDEGTTWLSWEGVAPYIQRARVLDSPARCASVRELPPLARGGEVVAAALDLTAVDKPRDLDSLRVRWRSLSGEVVGGETSLAVAAGAPSEPVAAPLGQQGIAATASLRSPAGRGTYRLEVGASSANGGWTPIHTLGGLMHVTPSVDPHADHLVEPEEGDRTADEVISLPSLVGDDSDGVFQAERAEYLRARAEARLAEGKGLRRILTLARRRAAYLIYRRIPALVARRLSH